MENTDYARRYIANVGEYHARLDAAVQDTLARMKGKGIVPPCGKGCSWCCHLPVNASAPEGLLAARYIGNKLDPKDKGVLLGRINGWLSWYEKGTREGERMECPFLKDSLCIIYDVRPMGCRVHYSEDAGACRQAIEGRLLFFEPPLIEEVFDAVKPLCMEYRRSLEAERVNFEDCLKPLPELVVKYLKDIDSQQ